ncbi:MAG TPA: LysR substrate-binding domain-containing protein [Stellaceae bacterium]|nr:LysR substrate-binding domain-containing protein [Stellaceae bacterium]
MPELADVLHALPSQLAGEHRPERVPPEPHSLVADVDPALEQEVFDVPQRERVADVHHDHEPDYLRRAVKIPERVGRFCHARRLCDALLPDDEFALTTPEAIIYTQRGGGGAWTFSKNAVEESVALNGRIRSTAAEAVREAVFADLGLAVASDKMFGVELRSGGVREGLIDWRLPSIDIWAVFPTGRRASAKARAFAAFVERALEAEAEG